MGRQKTISDEQVLRVARDLFRDKGHTATTREIAQAAGISEAILYQRFGSKDDLFFAAMPSYSDLGSRPRTRTRTCAPSWSAWGSILPTSCRWWCI